MINGQLQDLIICHIFNVVVVVVVDVDVDVDVKRRRRFLAAISVCKQEHR